MFKKKKVIGDVIAVRSKKEVKVIAETCAIGLVSFLILEAQNNSAKEQRIIR